MDTDSVAFIRELQKLPNAHDWSGDCSLQVAFHLGKGLYLNIGTTDEDVSEKIGLWSRLWQGRVPENST